MLTVKGVGKILFCHASPDSDTEILTRATPENSVAPLFADVDADLVVCGHTHMQFDRTIGDRRVINTGSVGMPLACALLNAGEHRRNHRRADTPCDEQDRPLERGRIGVLRG